MLLLRYNFKSWKMVTEFFSQIKYHNINWLNQNKNKYSSLLHPDGTTVLFKVMGALHIILARSA
jgi:hypothetical protein